MRPIALVVIISAFLTSGPAFADTADELRAHLSRLHGDDPVEATFDVQVWSRATGFSDGTPEQGHTTFRVKSGGSGIEFQYPPGELARAEAEEARNRANPELKTPTMTALREIDALEAVELLNFAPKILGYIERGKVIGDKAASYAGQPVQQLSLSVDPPIPRSLKKRLRDVSYVVNLWIGADGFPLGGEAVLHGKARFLVVSFEHNQTQRWAFARRGDRLVVARHSDQMNGSGLGNKFERRLNVQVKLR